MDPKQYKEFRDEAYWLTYKKHIISTLDAQELSHLIDVTYVVLNKELDKAQAALLVLQGSSRCHQAIVV